MSELAPPFQRALPLSELPEGRMASCQLAGREVVICHTREGVFALENICTHALARMSEGRLRGQRLRCPVHGASFDVRSGKVLGAPATQSLNTYASRVIDGYVEVAIAP